MKNFTKKLFQLTSIIFFILSLFVAITLAWGTVNDYQPELILSLESKQNANKKIITDSTLSFLIWNIGFGGLGRESDFFLNTESIYWSSIKQILPDKKWVKKNIAGIIDFIRKTEADFFLLQEVDKDAKRSYGNNQLTLISQQKPAFAAIFSPNYNVPRNPIPFFQPWNTYGKVYSGLATYSAYQPTKSTRFQLPGDYGWPDRIFHLDRCAAVHRFDTDFGKELVVINIHNSAFDQGGFLKKQQMAFLKDMVLAEYENGNFVVMGGDWNMCPVDFPPNTFRPNKAVDSERNIPKDFIPEGWQLAFDPSIPTIRSSSHPYLTDSTYVSLIDFYLVSPNVTVEKVEGIDMDFEFSDHQPVRLEVRLGAE